MKASTVVGGERIGGKASGLLSIQRIIDAQTAPGPSLDLSIPRFTVLAAEVFDRFIEMNDLWALARSDEADVVIALAFQKASLPPDVLGDLRTLVEQTRTPIAVRSSSALEDARQHPFAGVYETKMIPNNQLDADTRFQKLLEAVKFVYASTFTASAKKYLRAAGYELGDEHMAVLVQEVVGRRHGDRFYPDISGVARSYSFYPIAGAAPADGVVDLALGLGKTIVDGGLCWTYSPARPRVGPPFGSIGEMLRQTQARFWAVNMGKPPAYDPVHEAEYLVQATLDEAIDDATLRFTASSYDPESDRLSPGASGRGPKLLNFAPLLVLNERPLNQIIRMLLTACQDAIGSPVEIEFAVTLDDGSRDWRFGFLQVRPMASVAEMVDVAPGELFAPEVFVASSRALGNGRRADVRHVLYVKPDVFDAKHTRRIAVAVAELNQRLVDRGEPYVLVGFGRWGSADPWLGIPVDWSQVSGAAAIVEAQLPQMNVELSQGAHFFQNLSSFQVTYFSVGGGGSARLDWDWLSRQDVVDETAFVRLVRTTAPLTIAVDGRSARGVITRPADI